MMVNKIEQKKLITSSEEYASKVFLIYKLTPEGFKIFYKELPEADFPNHSNPPKFGIETPLNEVVYCTINQAKKAVLEFLDIVDLRWKI